ncbi:catechol 2,3-dioxygenase-like lactoylglutathione lyase family enzyme [Enterovirga rhinocerotis]|uniref:Catechol 2,3-dioxygenase-like lactoylglutathione lyase family enzyme n=2 Tax=Enterovirga rhinocerotis TaxID=1339210 RepID=A0A4R7BUI5_9HYPH|nr:VOC family protein [Enterovirga rhinocerotis]TDR88245.1 catechol 2,3-dioxygenase-like lactoylglutathione lyase family enzyme [Enterovirga rhinocerotis]
MAEKGSSEAAPLIDGVLETALYVDDLTRATAFYEGLLGLRRLFGDERLVALDHGRRGVLLLFRRGTTRETVTLPGGTIPPHDGHGPIHIAFAIREGALPLLESRLSESAIAIEGRTRWPRGGDSIYVRDPDGHLVEFATPGLWAIY